MVQYIRSRLLIRKVGPLVSSRVNASLRKDDERLRSFGQEQTGDFTRWRCWPVFSRISEGHYADQNNRRLIH